MGVFGDWAVRYFEAGLSVIPVDGKRAFTSGWNEWCDKLPSEDLVTEWVSKYPNHNIGLCTGAASGIVALDIDTDDKGILEIIASIAPPSPCSKRGAKGITYFYKFTDEIKTSCKVKGNNLFDILAGGSQTVIPPSWHPTANVAYSWIGKSLLDLDDELPILGKDTVNKLMRALAGFDVPESEVKSEGRNTSLKAYVAALSDSKTIEELVELALRYDECVFSGRELFKDKSEFKSDDAYYNAFEFVSNIKKAVMKRKLERGEKSGGIEEKLSNFAMIEAAGFYTMSVSESGAVKHNPEYLIMADYFHYVVNLKVSDSMIYVYKDNHYQPMLKIMLKNKVLQLTKGICKSNHQLNTFMEFAKVRNAFDPSLLTPNDGFINLQNGVLDVKAGRLLPHSPEIFFKYIIKHKYDPSAKCPEWLAFLSRTFSGDQELIQMSKEIFGYVLSGCAPWLHKAFFLYGEGRNGKSTWLDVLREIIGLQNISVIPLKNLDKPFSVVTADGKLANIVGETSSEDLSSESFKTAVGGEALIAAQKGQPEYAMPFTAKMIFAANKKPFFKDATAGSYEKLVFMPFNNYIKPEDRIPEYARRYLFKEIPGIINWAIEGLLELEKRGKLIESKAIELQLEDYRFESDSVYSWVKQWVVFENVTVHCKVLISSYYEHYRQWCDAEYRNAVSKIEFSRRVKFILAKDLHLEEERTNRGLKISGLFSILAKANLSRKSSGLY